MGKDDDSTLPPGLLRVYLHQRVDCALKRSIATSMLRRSIVLSSTSSSPFQTTPPDTSLLHTAYLLCVGAHLEGSAVHHSWEDTALSMCPCSLEFFLFYLRPSLLASLYIVRSSEDIVPSS
eukprot:TRINITY_DN13671_c0_g1_i1.p1 TRINITY_DN13671_c0_g1~~TRINITY_DN13671_c0_g1_i1.p1  ORF type:complete len:121 (+),score=1.63 TRINITY_DN13671_c0_g1_i1:101-463(+)